MTLLMWAILALVLGIALLSLEIFVPSGGILGFLTFCAMTTAIVLAFMHSLLAGLSIMLAVMVAIPAVVIVGINFLPYTYVGRHVLLKAPTAEEVLPTAESWGKLTDLVGQIGKAKTKMLPSGAVEVNGRTVDAVSEGLPIDPGQLVKVVEVRANRVVVRPVEDGELLSTPTAPAGQVDLSQPIDSLGLSTFENPLS